MTRGDLEHKLLSGGTIDIDGYPTYSVTLWDMADYGFVIMQNIISLMSADDTASSRILGAEDGEFSTYHLLHISIMQELHHPETTATKHPESLLCNAVPSFLSLFFRREVLFDEKIGFYFKDDEGNIAFVLNEKNYNEFRNILKHRNCLIDTEDEYDENPTNEMAAKLLAKRKMLRERVRKSKLRTDEDGLSMADLISIFAEAENMPLQKVYRNYDMYQFNNQFNRLRIMDDYHVNIQFLTAGAKKDELKIQHWLSKINSNNGR